jgi:phosphotransferase system  glucose/maltose/N-acetylglucosamine-specific IIC component
LTNFINKCIIANGYTKYHAGEFQPSLGTFGGKNFIHIEPLTVILIINWILSLTLCSASWAKSALLCLAALFNASCKIL